MAVLRLVVTLLCLLAAPSAWSAVTVTDDRGRELTLDAPARRIVSLAPHITELLFSAGAGDRVVGAVDYSDHPPAAAGIPRIGGYSRIDLEALLARRPDLVVGWHGGNPAAALEQIERLGLPLYLTEPATLEQIASNIERLGTLAGTEKTAGEAARSFRSHLAALSRDEGGQAPVRVFYQVWNAPLMTINGEHLISHLIERCGGVNVFAGLDNLSPTLTLEAVLSENPDLIVASGMGEERPEWLDGWRRWPELKAVANDQLRFVPPDLLQRPTLRVLEGAGQLCRHIDDARSRQDVKQEEEQKAP